MKISKSKQELARIISEKGGWRDGMEWAWYGNLTNSGYFGVHKPTFNKDYRSIVTYEDVGLDMYKFECGKIPNWHQTILSREEYFHLYPAPDADGWIEWNGGEAPVGFCALVDVKLRGGNVELGQQFTFSDSWCHHSGSLDIIAYRLHKPEKAIPESAEPDEQVWTNQPTIEQLAADYRDAKCYAERKRREADNAKAEAEAKLADLVAASKDLGLVPASAVKPAIDGCMQLVDMVPTRLQSHQEESVAAIGYVVNVERLYDKVRYAFDLLK